MHFLAQKIAALQRRIAITERAASICYTIATILAAALLLGIVDYFVRYDDPGLRIMATAVLVAVAAWAIYRWWYLPARIPLIPLAVARRVEARFPQFNDSLASALEFLQQSEEDRTAGSAQLRRLVIAEAATTIDGLPIDEVIDRRQLRRAASWLGAVGLALVLCLAWDAGAVGTALARLAAPLGSTQWPRQHYLAFRDPPTRLAAGQTFEVELLDKAGELPDEVRIEYRLTHDGRREMITESMSRVGTVMVGRRENLRESFAFRAEGGDDDTMRWHRVEVVDPPKLESLKIMAHPPEYTALPPATAQRHLEVLAGTNIELHGVASEPLNAARVLPEGSSPIAASISTDAAGRERHAFHIEPGEWTATTSGKYSVELSDDAGLAGVVGQWNLRVEPDSPPRVVWQRPSDDLYVTPEAVVPIEIQVKDNLAVQRVELTYQRSDRSEAERARQPKEPTIELYRGPTKANSQPTEPKTSRGKSHLIEYAWELAPLNLPVGAELSIEAEAADYRPGLGHAASPRRITIITADELEARLADHQAQIVRQLERALAIEQRTREDVRRLEIQQRDVGTLTPGDRTTLQAAELNQRRVSRTLVDPNDGVPALTGLLLSEIEINRIADSPTQATIDRLADELQQLSTGPLSLAERELTGARKTVDAVTSDDDIASAGSELPISERQAALLSQSLTAVGAAQDETIAFLERLINELSTKADLRRFIRLMSELRQDQLSHAEAAGADIGLETLPLRVSELSRAQRATLNKAAAGQNALAQRYDKIEYGMDELAQQLTDDEDEVADKLTDAVSLARRLAIGAKMQEIARDLGENRIGAALARESQIAADIQQVLDVLRNTSEQQPEQLAEGLRDAEERMAALREQLAALREEIAQSEQQTSTAANELAQLNAQQQQLRREVERLARQLDRLQAADASESSRNAASKLGQPSTDANQHPQAAQKYAPSNQVQQAEQDLEQAAQQLAARRQQAEDDLAVEFVRRFQAELTEMVKRQRQVIEETVALNNQQQPGAQPAERVKMSTNELADEERRLAQLAKEHSELLFGLGAVRVSLEEAELRLAAAAEFLDDSETGSAAQQAEELALVRLEGMMQAFAQTADEAGQNPAAQPGAGAGVPPNNQPQRRPTFELIEVKMLRMLQVDLHERTREYQKQLAAPDGPPSQESRPELEREAQEIAAQQGRLAELVQNMLARDNEDEEDGE